MEASPTTERPQVTYTVFTESTQDHTDTTVIATVSNYGDARRIARQHAAGIMFTDQFEARRMREAVAASNEWAQRTIDIDGRLR
jgi:hypothetical protein